MNNKKLTDAQLARAAPKWLSGLRSIRDATLPSNTKGMTAVEAGRLIERVHALAVEARRAGLTAVGVDDADDAA